MGQNAAHIDAIAGDQTAVFRLRQLGLIPTEQVRKQHRELNGIPEPEPRRREESANAIAIRELVQTARSRLSVPEPVQDPVNPSQDHAETPAPDLAPDPEPETRRGVEAVQDVYRVMPSPLSL
jgi:hypothetical protein